MRYVDTSKFTPPDWWTKKADKLMAKLMNASNETERKKSLTTIVPCGTN